MRIYAVLERPVAPGRDPDAVLVREGFSWPAFLVAPLWALYRRQWLGLALYVLALILLALATVALDQVTGSALALGFAVLVASNANDWRCRTLERQGYALVGVVAAPDLEIAEARWFRGRAAGAAAAPPGAPLPPPPVPPVAPA